MKHARLLALVGVALATRASAHLMVAQHGTVNVVGDGAFLVLSVPAAAFPFADEDGDGRLSPLELQRHQAEVGAAVQSGVRLLEGDTSCPLEGLLFSLTPDELAPEDVGAQVVVLGRGWGWSGSGLGRRWRPATGPWQGRRPPAVRPAGPAAVPPATAAVARSAAVAVRCP